MKRTTALAFVFALAPFAAMAQSNPSTGTAAPAATLPMQPGTANAGTLSATDANFVKEAAAGGLAEVDEGKIAQQRGDSTVKKIGSQMVVDHTHANADLLAIVKAQNIAAPTQVDPMHADAISQLRKMRGKAFDNAYLNDQLTDHQKTIALFQQESDQGTDPRLKAFAASTLPILQGHLEMVKNALSQTRQTS